MTNKQAAVLRRREAQNKYQRDYRARRRQEVEKAAQPAEAPETKSETPRSLFDSLCETLRQREAAGFMQYEPGGVETYKFGRRPQQVMIVRANREMMLEPERKLFAHQMAAFNVPVVWLLHGSISAIPPQTELVKISN